MQSAPPDEASLRRLSLGDVGAVLALFESSVPYSLAAAGVSRSLLTAVARGEPSGAYCRAACVVAEAGARRLVGAVLTVTVPARPLPAGPAKALAGERSGGGGGALPPPPPPKPFHLKFALLREPSAEHEVVIVLAVAVERAHRRCGLGADLVFAGVRAHSLESARTVAVRWRAARDAPSASCVSARHRSRQAPIFFARRHCFTRRTATTRPLRLWKHWAFVCLAAARATTGRPLAPATRATRCFSSLSSPTPRSWRTTRPPTTA